MKLSNSNRTLAITAAAIFMSVYQLSPMPSWACSASTSAGFAYSSNTGPTSVTVCARSVASTRTVAVATKSPAVKAPVPKAPASPVVLKPVAKPAPTPAKSLLTPIKQGVPAALQKPVSKPATKPVAKPAPKPLPAPTPAKTQAKTSVKTSSTASVTTSGEVSFSPAPISLGSSESRALTGQEVTFWASAATHFKSGLLLGKVTDVRFTPIETVWSSDQGHSGVGASTALVFESSGSVEVMAYVTYAVAYQIFGASGWVSSGEITVSDSIDVTINDAPEESVRAETPPAKVVRLVGKNCLGRTAVFGCNP